MRLAVAALLSLLAFTAVAQAPATGPSAVETARRRAPLADVDELEPAVDVGATRVAVAGSASTASSTASRPQAAPAAPPVAPAPPQPASAPAPRSGSPRAMDSLDLGTTSITGNQELPKVLYIVPWKKSDLGDLVGRPVNTLLDEVLAPVDPDVFERHLDYYKTLHGASQEE